MSDSLEKHHNAKEVPIFTSTSSMIGPSTNNKNHLNHSSSAQHTISSPISSSPQHLDQPSFLPKKSAVIPSSAKNLNIHNLKIFNTSKLKLKGRAVSLPPSDQPCENHERLVNSRSRWSSALDVTSHAYDEAKTFYETSLNDSGNSGIGRDGEDLIQNFRPAKTSIRRVIRRMSVGHTDGRPSTSQSFTHPSSSSSPGDRMAGNFNLSGGKFPSSSHITQMDTSTEFLSDLAHEMEQLPAKPPKIIPKKVDYVRRGKTGRVNECLMEERYATSIYEREGSPGFYNGKSFILEVPMKGEDEISVNNDRRPESSSSTSFKTFTRLSSHPRAFKLSTSVENVSDAMTFVHQFSNEQDIAPTITAQLLFEVRDLEITSHQMSTVKLLSEDDDFRDVERTVNESEQWIHGMEKNIVQAGLPSPFRKVNEIFPPFDEIHIHLRTHLRRHMPSEKDRLAKHMHIDKTATEDEFRHSESTAQNAVSGPIHEQSLPYSPVSELSHTRAPSYHIKSTIFHEEEHDDYDDDNSTNCSLTVMSNEESLISILSKNSHLERQQRLAPPPKPKHSSIFITCQAPLSEDAKPIQSKPYSLLYGDNQFMDFSDDVAFMANFMYSIPYNLEYKNWKRLSLHPTSLCLSKFELKDSGMKFVLYQYHGKNLRFSRKGRTMVIEGQDDRSLGDDSVHSEKFEWTRFGNRMSKWFSGDNSPQSPTRIMWNEDLTEYLNYSDDEDSLSVPLNTTHVALSEITVPEMILSKNDASFGALPTKPPRKFKRFSLVKNTNSHSVDSSPSATLSIDEETNNTQESSRSSLFYGWNRKSRKPQPSDQMEKSKLYSLSPKREALTDDLAEIPIQDLYDAEDEEMINSSSSLSTLNPLMETSMEQVSLAEADDITTLDDHDTLLEEGQPQNRPILGSKQTSIYGDIVSQRHLKCKAAFGSAYSRNEPQNLSPLESAQQQPKRPQRRYMNSLFNVKEDVNSSDEEEGNVEATWESSDSFKSDNSRENTSWRRNQDTAAPLNSRPLFNRSQGYKSEDDFGLQQATWQHSIRDMVRGRGVEYQKSQQMELDLL